MKKRIYTLLILTSVLCVTIPVQGQMFAVEPATYTWTLEAQLGVQMGGAIPIPLTALSGTESAVHASMGLCSQAAVLGSRYLSPQWRLYAGVAYAASGFEADARVSNQRIKEKDANGQTTEKYFTGVSHIEQSFAFLEVPIYAQLSLSLRSKLLMGIYGGYQITGMFKTTAKKGFTGVNPDEVGASVTAPILSDFSQDLRAFDFGMLAGYEFIVMTHLSAALRFSFSPIDIFASGRDFFDYSMHQLRGTLTLTYTFFGN